MKLSHFVLCTALLFITLGCAVPIDDTLPASTGTSNQLLACGSTLSVSLVMDPNMSSVTAGAPVSFLVTIAGGSGSYLYGLKGMAPTVPIEASGSITDTFSTPGSSQTETIEVKDLGCSQSTMMGVSAPFSVIVATPPTNILTGTLGCQVLATPNSIAVGGTVGLGLQITAPSGSTPQSASLMGGFFSQPVPYTGTTVSIVAASPGSFAVEGQVVFAGTNPIQCTPITVTVSAAAPPFSPPLPVLLAAVRQPGSIALNLKFPINTAILMNE